jgi:transposase
VSLLAEWPPNSPDLSPIENLWAIVQRRVDAAGCKTFAEFKKTLQKEWDGVSKQLCSKLITGINTRLAECIKREGRRTDY